MAETHNSKKYKRRRKFNGCENKTGHGTDDFFAGDEKLTAEIEQAETMEAIDPALKTTGSERNLREKIDERFGDKEGEINEAVHDIAKNELPDKIEDLFNEKTGKTSSIVRNQHYREIFLDLVRKWKLDNKDKDLGKIEKEELSELKRKAREDFAEKFPNEAKKYHGVYSNGIIDSQKSIENKTLQGDTDGKNIQSRENNPGEIKTNNGSEGILEVKKKFPTRVTFRHGRIKDSLAFISKYYKDQEEGELAEIIFESWDSKKKATVRKTENIRVSQLAERLKDYNIDEKEIKNNLSTEKIQEIKEETVEERSKKSGKKREKSSEGKRSKEKPSEFSEREKHYLNAYTRLVKDSLDYMEKEDYLIEQGYDPKDEREFQTVKKADLKKFWEHELYEKLLEGGKFREETIPEVIVEIRKEIEKLNRLRAEAQDAGLE